MEFASDDSAVKVKVKLLEKSQIAPPPGSTPTKSLPITFFDVFWLFIPSPVKCLFFFYYHHSNHHFYQTVLPNIKRSLSLALQHYYPFAGNLRRPSDDNDHDSTMLDFFYADGDSIALTIAESDSGRTFDYLVGHQARNARDFDHLAPDLEPKSADDQYLLSPLMAVQVTLFPNSGICIGITSSHAVADGKTTTQFIKFWASICKFGLEEHHETPLVLSGSSLPFYCRNVIKDPKGLCKVHLNQIQDANKAMESSQVANSHVPSAAPLVHKVRATFVMSRPEIEKLKQRVIKKMIKENNNNSAITWSTVNSFHVSTFVVACAYVWVCLVKSRRSDEDIDDNDVDVDNKECFLYAVDCRDRLDPPIPEIYYGNCLLPFVAQVNKSDLIGEEGIGIAAEAIGRGVERMNGENGVMERAETFLTELSSMMASGVRVVSVAGSPKFKVYETDFGWGKPKKVEVVSIEDSGAISLWESRDDEERGGIEVGLVLNKLEMDVFASLFKNTLMDLA